MNITNVTVTKVAEESTENADYQLEYSIVNDALTRVHASIRKKAPAGHAADHCCARSGPASRASICKGGTLPRRPRPPRRPPAA